MIAYTCPHAHTYAKSNRTRRGKTNLNCTQERTHRLRHKQAHAHTHQTSIFYHHRKHGGCEGHTVTTMTNTTGVDTHTHIWNTHTHTRTHNWQESVCLYVLEGTHV
eukprot:GDKI01003997.1.p2 GENE.GDKI01003997.1~~GDKI01003997.1.p2  ORF type:complete len:106 (-),score=39.62 GDKI01003997.1:77-394(-)